MAYEVLDARWLSPNVKRFVVRAPHVTYNCKPGQFVIVRATSGGERIPLTIADYDRERQTIVLIVQALGASTALLCGKERGNHFRDVAGPMGKPTEIERCGHAVLVGGGVGTAVIYPQAKALKDAGNRVTAIIGGRSRAFVILEPELNDVCDEVLVCTDDGSYGFKGFATQRLRQLLAETKHWRLRCDRIAVVDCSEETQVQRVMARAGWPQEQVHQVIVQQAARPVRRAIADAVLHNDGLSLDQLQQQATALWRHWTTVRS